MINLSDAITLQLWEDVAVTDVKEIEIALDIVLYEYWVNFLWAKM